MVADLVSMITPCYGTASYLPKLLRSIIKQTYPQIELFVIDDGSPDDIQGVVKEFEPEFRKKGYRIEYIRQFNSGQSVAIQNGLDKINGEYLVWPDSDDFYASENSISKMVDRFKLSGQDVGMVRTQEIIVRDNAENTPIQTLGKNAKEEESRSLFEDCLLQKNGFYFCSGAYMIKSEALMSSTRLPIYTEKDAGQNWQLLLPVLYNYRCSTILEPLYNVVERITSHSRVNKSYERSCQRIETYKRTLLGTLQNIRNISADDLHKYTEMVEANNQYIHLINALIYNKKAESIRLFQQLNEQGHQIDKRTMIKYILLRIGMLDTIHKSKKIISHILN
ncbi:MAG: glycosyltransferase family 2 protein [Bacteroides sp.]|nr:glycosyltransferase family 2 protein [Bacteroides sp.]